jgi:hypothetical protein
MLQTDRWRSALADVSPLWPDRVVGSLSTPFLVRGADGWITSDWVGEEKIGSVGE